MSNYPLGVITQDGHAISLFNVQPLVVVDVDMEIQRQFRLQRSGKFEDTCRTGTDEHNVSVISEEALEALEQSHKLQMRLLGVARAVNDRAQSEKLRKELIEVAACALQWVMRIDEEKS